MNQKNDSHWKAENLNTVAKKMSGAASPSVMHSPTKLIFALYQVG